RSGTPRADKPRGCSSPASATSSATPPFTDRATRCRCTAPPTTPKVPLPGERNIISHASIYGAGDALQVNGSAYITDSLIAGDGDTILGRGPAFFTNCERHA